MRLSEQHLAGLWAIHLEPGTEHCSDLRMVARWDSTTALSRASRWDGTKALKMGQKLVKHWALYSTLVKKKGLMMQLAEQKDADWDCPKGYDSAENLEKRKVLRLATVREDRMGLNLVM